MPRGGKPRDSDAPTRKCIVTGETNPKRGLIRFVNGPDDTIYTDIGARLPGRGMYLSAERHVLESAIRKNAFAKSARAKVKVPDDLIDQVEQALLRRVIERIGLARKAGQAVSGYETVKDWLEQGKAAILCQAVDGSARGKSKLRPPGGRGSFFEVLTASELGLSFGREHVIHAALAAGRLANTFRDDAVRLSGVRDFGQSDQPMGKVIETQ